MLASAAPQPPTRVLLRSFVHAGDPKAATNAVRTFVEFVEAQIRKLDDRDARRPKPSRGPRPPSQQPAVDPRSWLDHRRWLAWTLDGDLVAIEESGTGSHRLRRVAEPQDLHDILAADRPIKDVIKLYPGDDLDWRPVSRFMCHNDLRQALTAALERARRCERSTVAVPAPATPPRPAPRLGKEVAHRKTRFHPDGNFILYRPADPANGLPAFVALQPGPPVPAAFASRRHAQRFIHRRRRPIDAEGLVVARVIGAATVEPVFRHGLDLPREAEDLVALIRKEPRVVLPDLHAEWEPRFEEGDDGVWRPQAFKFKRTVRHAYTRQVLQELGEATQRVVPLMEAREIRLKVGGDDEPVPEVMQALRVSQKAERRLPQAWLDRLGMERESLGPDWRQLHGMSFAPPLHEDAHWVRAPVEYGQLYVDRKRGRIVELRIDDLAGLIELLGFRWRFLVVKDSTQVAPRWVLPMGEVEGLAVMAG